MPRPRYGFASCTDGKHIFTFGGSSENITYHNSIYQYDPVLNRWLDLSNRTYFIPQRYGRCMYDERTESIFLTGGNIRYGRNVALQDVVYHYDIRKRTIKPIDTSRIKAKLHGMAYWQGKIYIFGGSTKLTLEDPYNRQYEYTDKMYSFDPVTGQWEQLPDLPEAMETNGTVINGKLYVLGGYDGTSKNKVYRYTLESGEWEVISEMDFSASAYALASYNQYIFLVGDYVESDRLAVFNTETYGWKTFEMNIEGRHMGAAVIKDELHVFGGIAPTSRFNVYYQHWKLDLEGLTWLVFRP